MLNRARVERPLGISLIVVIFFITGFAFITQEAYNLWIGMSISSMMLLCVEIGHLVAGVELWRLKKRGWWLAVFLLTIGICYSFSLAR
jgi:hypothetical protein